MSLKPLLANNMKRDGTNDLLHDYTEANTFHNKQSY